jgi:hypothetical protein
LGGVLCGDVDECVGIGGDRESGRLGLVYSSGLGVCGNFGGGHEDWDNFCERDNNQFKFGPG